MDIFINSTFAQSVRGYRLMRMTDSGFRDIMSSEELPEPVYSFMSEDLFKVLWCETAEDKRRRELLLNGSYIGIKGFTGTFNNQKNGIADIVFYAGEDELFRLAALANRIICSYMKVSEIVFRSITIDSDGNYSVDSKSFINELEALPAGDYPDFVGNKDFSYRSSADLLHLAVCIGSRERAYEKLPGKLSALRKAACIIDESSFMEYVSNRSEV